MSQRSACSVLRAAGLDHLLVGKDLQEYQDIAVRLGLDKDFFTIATDHIVTSTKTSTLFIPPINAIIVGLRKAYELWYEGHEPHVIMMDEFESRIRQESGVAGEETGHEYYEAEL